ncbi:ParB/RepB/Spo0J family partition protein [Candidatus Competibacter phosphatis]|uniref:ParB/RepB/Spo0J family partition protein n=1 Tax=Candidatus Competibacter phosphatis TaxID=221280 RepID=A0ABX1TT20_9GAMM|nr:ParB/RepB/Spo0J family partition protein [Candidatus Competibacter phosphatis]MCB1795366.1 ParB/RepB/Spo0J family partition protein [Candidatus Competibacteraceae bacterium]NMQ21119.1 ParB/RepB/Spo0J family partition protein [Candidatus Competibacter phosphatis]HRW67444.1 ParB/RepB/Spo0J family partition protein [Candidatus Competibacter sp.]
MNPPKSKKDFFFGTSPDLPKIVEVNLSEIHPNPDQPRKTFDEEKLRELAHSIERQGLIQPITLKKRDASEGGYLLVAGERRFRAHQLLEKTTIPAIITQGNPDEISLIENIQREDLNPLEEAEALERMMARYHYTQEELGKVIGKAQNTVSETLQLNSLPLLIKEDYRTSDSRVVSKSALIELTRIKDADQQRIFWESMKRGQWTVRETRRAKTTANPSAPVQEKAVGSGRAFLRKIQRIEVIDDEHYQALVELSEALREHLSRLRPPEEHGAS